MIRLRHAQRLRQLIQRHPILGHPGAVGLTPDYFRLDFFVVDNTALYRINQKHTARLEPPFFTNIFHVGRQDSGFGRQDDQIIRRHLIPAGP